MSSLVSLVTAAMNDLKAQDVITLDVRGMTTVTDYMIIASGRSDRQVKAIADKLIEAAKLKQIEPLGIEGRQQAEWILIDFGDVIAHVMRAETREYYQLEKLWSFTERADSLP